MDLRQLTYFVQVCRDRSFTKAASNLFISQQGLSISIKRLEDELNCKLLIRTDMGYLPSPEGEYLLDQAGRILSLINECDDFFHVETSLLKLLVVACVVDVIGYCPDFFSPFMTEKEGYPRVKFIEQTSRRCEEMVLKGEADLAFVPEPVPKELFYSIPLFQVHNAIVLHRNHPLCQEKKISFRQLKGQKIISYNHEYKLHAMLVERCHMAGFQPDIVLELDRASEIFRIIQQNPKFIGVCNEYTAQQEAGHDLRVIPVEDESFNWEICLIQKRETIRSMSMNQFINLSLEYFQDRNNSDGCCGQM